MGLLDVLFIILILFAGHRIVDVVVARHNLSSHRVLLIKLFYFHLLFSLLFALYILVNGGDAVGYWRSLREYEEPDFSVWSLYENGTPFIRFLVYPFSHLLQLSFWTGSLMFSLLGFIGFLFLFLTFKRTLTCNPHIWGVKLFPLILFLPNMHFWSGGVGKDTLMFLALNIFIFSLTAPLKNIPGFIFSFYLAFYIRPHIALLMVVGFGFSMLTSLKGLSLFWRLIFFSTSIALFIFIAPSVFDFIKVDSGEISQIEEISVNRAKGLVKASVGSAIDITNYSMTLRIITFLFRPLFFDAPNLFGIIISFENLFYVLLAFSLFLPSNWKTLFRLPTHLKAALFVVASTAYFLSSTLSNLGLVLRQKNMVMFMFVLITAYLLSKAQEKSVAKSPSVVRSRSTRVKTTAS